MLTLVAGWWVPHSRCIKVDVHLEYVGEYIYICAGILAFLLWAFSIERGCQALNVVKIQIITLECALGAGLGLLGRGWRAKKKVPGKKQKKSGCLGCSLVFERNFGAKRNYKHWESPDIGPDNISNPDFKSVNLVS